MAIAGTNITLDPTEGMDKISTTEKVTTPYFSNGATTLTGTSIVSSSLSDTNETYFFGISNSTTPTVEEFNVSFGSTNGYGANVATDTKSETEAIYKQFANVLLAPTEVTGGFFISSPAETSAIETGKDEEIFIVTSKRSNMKDRINKGTWLIALSGSASTGAAATKLYLGDDSINDTPTATPVGDRYNIVKQNSDGVIQTQSTVTNFGFFYPDMGVMVFSQQELSASIPGDTAQLNDVVIFQDATHTGFDVGTNVARNGKFALRFINCLQGGDASLKFRDEEDQVSAQYFCRVRSGHANFSNNPTFVSGSLNELRQSTMKGNPSTFISSVQLYNNAGDVVAVGNLSKALKKNFTSEATVKVKLTY